MHAKGCVYSSICNRTQMSINNIINYIYSFGEILHSNENENITVPVKTYTKLIDKMLSKRSHTKKHTHHMASFI